MATGKPTSRSPTDIQNASILLGNGDGTFTAAPNNAAGANPAAIAVGDFNGDGKVDLAVANTNSNDVSILFGNGNGTFAAAISFDAGSGPSLDAIGDFNGDGKLDIAVANFFSNGVSILLNGCPDLTVSKTHTGNFTQGSSQTYTITVNNIGSARTVGLVTVTDNLPPGLRATDLFGGGQWVCILATLTCTRSDRLDPGFSYEAITLFVNVNSNAPAMVTNTATVSGGSELNTANDNRERPDDSGPELFDRADERDRYSYVDFRGHRQLGRGDSCCELSGAAQFQQ